MRFLRDLFYSLASLFILLVVLYFVLRFLAARGVPLAAQAAAAAGA